MTWRRLSSPARRLLTNVMVFIATGAVVGALAGGVIALRAIQHSRYENTVRACRRDNHEHRLNITFVKRFGPELEREARRTYNVVPDCASWARRRIGR